MQLLSRRGQDRQRMAQRVNAVREQAVPISTTPSVALQLRDASSELRLQQIRLKTEMAKRCANKLAAIKEDFTRLSSVREDSVWSPGLNNFFNGSIGSGPLVDDDSGSVFDPICYQTEDAIDEASFREWQRRQFKITIQMPLAYGWIETAVQHIVGDKFQMKSLDDDPRTQEAWDKQAENMAGPRATYAWPFRIQAQDSVRAALRLGDDMFTYNVNGYDGSFNCREMEPVWVYNPGKSEQFPFLRQWTPNVMATFGIQTNPDDMDQVVTFWYDQYRNGRLVGVPATNVQHTKFNGTRRMKRGRPWLTPVLKPLLRLDKTLEARALMHLNRAEMSFHYEAPEGLDPNLLQALMQENQLPSTAGINANDQYANHPGSMEMLSRLKKVYTNPNLEAGDARWDILTQMQPIARALGLSMQTAFGITDATMATAREANLPEILMFEWAQDWFMMNTFNPEGQRCIKSKIETGMLDALSYKEFDEVSKPASDNIRVKGKTTVPRNTNFQGSYPKLRVSDPKALTDSVLAQRAAYLIDDEEAMTMLGYDAQLMKNRVELQRREDLKHAEQQSALAELQGMLKQNGSNGNGSVATAHVIGKTGRSDSKAIYRRSGTAS